MTPTPALSPQTPWPGLRPFGEDDRGFFFGRERETADLSALVQRAVVVILYGQSGLGKTSLLQAGLFPVIRDASLLPLRLRLDHGEHAPAASAQIKAALISALDAAGVTGPRPRPDETLWEYFHRRDVDLWGARNRLIKPVIVFDQFEEVFTLGQRSEAAIARVAEVSGELEALLEHRAPDAVRARLELQPDDALHYDFQREGVKFVISLREDFLAQLDTWRARLPSLLPHRFRLERMTGAQALDVVQRAGGDLVDPAIAKEIVDFVSRSQRRAQTGALQARNVEPALLSVVCDELNRRRLDRKQPRITADLLSGERQGIIQAFYNRALEDVDPRVRDWIEDELLTVSGYRDRAAQEDALKTGVVETDIDRLVDRRILHREERDGVVWLELAHDLLTDPAFASRTQREQRRVADEAVKREAETAQRLRRTTRLAAGFGVLSLAMVVAMFFAFRMSQRANDAQASMQIERDKAKTAEASAGAAAASAEKSASLAKAEADRASSSFNTAMGMAEPLGRTLRDFVRGDMRLVTPSVLEIIARADDSYRLLEAQDAAATADQRAGFLVTAAQALYEVGHLTDGVGRAEQALAILDEHRSGASTGRALRAEALYARASGYGATGRMAQARTDYAEAMAQAGAEAQVSGWNVDLARIDVLSELGLGELDRWSLAFASAEAHYQRVLGFLTSHPLKDADAVADTWREQALMGLAVSATDPAEEERRYARANATLEHLVSADPDNLRLLKLSAEIGFLRGRNAADLGRLRLAAAYSAAGDAASTHLTQHDRDNLQWKLVWIRAQRAVGYLDQDNGQWTAARTTLEAAERAVADLERAEPGWRQARYVHGALWWEIAQAYRGQDQPERAIELMVKARDEFAAGIRRIPGDLEFVRGVPLALGGMAAAHLDHGDNDDVIQLSKQAITALEPAERVVPNDSAVQSNKAYYFYLIGRAWAAKSSWKDVIDAYNSRVAILTTLALRSRLASDETVLAGALLDLGEAWQKSGDATKAAAEYDRASDAVTRALAVDSTDSDTVHESVIVRRRQISLMSKPSDVPVAFGYLESESTLLWNALEHQAWDTTLQADLAGINKSLEGLKPIITGAGLPPAQSAALLAKIDPLIAARQASTLVNWVIPPMMPGAWRNLTASELDAARTTVLDAYPKLHGDQIFAVRTLSLAFRKNAEVLYEAGVEADNGDRGIVAFVGRAQQGTSTPGDAGGVAAITGSRRYTLLDGTSSPVYQMNSESAPLLDTVEHATAYYRFFLGAVHGDLGPFKPVERPDEVMWRADASEDVRAGIAKNLVPVQLAKQPDGSWATPCTLIYGNTLFLARMRINPSGGMTVDDGDRALMNNLPVVVEGITDGVKTLHDITDMYERELAKDLKQLEASPTDRKMLADAVDMELKLGRRKDAAPLQQRIVNAMRADATVKKADLLGAYISLSWYQLFARDFVGALASTDAGHRLDPADLYLETNRAHALLFLGRIPEAEAVYRAHLGQKIGPDSTERWEQAILDDLDELDKAGITSPEFARIRRLMGGK